jgi:hypothetical protein
VSTSHELIEQAQRDVKPRDILYPSVFPEARSLLPLDCGSLKRLVDLSVERKLTWEEWLDVREAWCRCFRVQYVACTRSDRAAIQNAAFQGERTGQNYILIDFI